MARHEIQDLSAGKRPPSSEHETNVGNRAGPGQMSEGFSASGDKLQQADGDSLECDLARLTKVFDDVRENRAKTSNTVPEDESSALVEPAHRMTDVKSKSDGSKKSGGSHLQGALDTNVKRV
ncbi:hypothetical protein PTTG_29031 [Puccinia triticina 1-1 BBBD Race 1]|uniref:Uncharacterized protein n=1 Tax=Puccinia triticina (isolate 1-1 / race 1 (BBBD)) TaxID=630390 RepID=A0A180G7Y7_PUCT1|nr:hypothetical protein PTTG_29031 [Puccinia triticina 1-1 BBBD Race 1]WAR56294.1 hypothetical protein PtB15_7B140 [Puccinia triticina]